MGKKNGLSRYLFRKGDTFYARMAIPKPLRAFFGGKDILIRSLGTRDPKVAENRKDIEVGQIKAEFERLANQDPLAPQAVGSLVRWERAISFGEYAMLSEDLEAESSPHRYGFHYHILTIWLYWYI